MKRVLCIVGGMNAGGAETFLMKIYRSLDKTKYQMDFAVAINEEGYYDREIKSYGGRIYHITPKSQGFYKNFADIKNLVKKEKYQFVLRISQNSLSALELFAAKLGGAKIRAFRSSNSNATGGKLECFLHKACLFMPKLFVNIRIAPSREAADFMFGKRAVKNGKVAFLHNAVDLNVYHYDVRAKENIRKEFGLEGKTVIGHIGRFNTQKNHAFLLDVFAEIRKKQPDAVLMLVGTGELEDEIRQKAERLGLTKHIIFTGVRSDVPQLLSAMDVFVFPSFYEGMPNTVIEAQATGLPCVIADTITKEADITGLVRYLPLEYSAEAWAEQALSMILLERKDTKQDFIDHQYDIASATKAFVQLVFGEE